MCGIGGILRVWPRDQRAVALRTPHEQSIPEAWLDIIDESIRHRGPDGHGRFRDRAFRADGCVVDVALVHRRLSIIDHAGGHQPMVLRIPKGALRASSGSSGSLPGASAGRPTTGRILTPEEVASHTRRIVAESHLGAAANPELALGAPSSGGHDHIAVVFNGCIYNHRELRAELQRAGHVFSTDHSDTEVLVHGWREWNSRLAEHLDGMYAAAIWDSMHSSLYVSRDFAHEKPLYLSSDREGLIALSSTAQGVLRWKVKTSGSIEASSDDWLGSWVIYGASDDPCSAETYWPARSMVHDVSAWHDHRGDLEFNALPRRDGSVRLDAKTVDRLLAESVRARLEADVDLGCFLSGGIDSSLVTYYASVLGGKAVRTFSVAMPDARYDESSWAAAAASHLGVQHTTLDCEARPAADLERLILEMGVPFGDSSLLPMYWVSRATRREVAVALSGDGGDELFAGYDRHVAALRYAGLARMLGRLPARCFPDIDPRSRSSKLRRLASAGANGYRELRAIFLRDDYARLVPGSSLLDFRPRQLNEPDPAGLDFYEYLGPDLMRKSDSASMSVALEVRSPFLSTTLCRACLSAPYADLMPRGQRKGLLRQVARKHLPSEIVDRPKMGFAIPIGEWFRSDYGGLRTMLLDHLNSAEPFGPPSLGIELNMNFVRQMLDEHLGTGPSGLVKRDHSQRLYMLLVLSIWAKWMAGLAGSSPRR